MCADIRVRIIVGIIAGLFLRIRYVPKRTGSSSPTAQLRTSHLWGRRPPIPRRSTLAVSPALRTNGRDHQPFTHLPERSRYLLVSPEGRAVMLISDVGSGTDWVSQRFVLDDCAPRLLADLPVTSGRFRPSNFLGNDEMPAGAPAGNYGNTLSDFNFSSTNGTWSLYVNDDVASDGGVIHSWSITTIHPTDIQHASRRAKPNLVHGSRLRWRWSHGCCRLPSTIGELVDRAIRARRGPEKSAMGRTRQYRRRRYRRARGLRRRRPRDFAVYRRTGGLTGTYSGHSIIALN